MEIESHRPAMTMATGEIPDHMAMPQVIEVYEEEWGKYDFSKDTALAVKGAGSDVYDFFINMDNLHLKWELKEWLAQNKEKELLQSRFKYAMVLMGMAILKETGKNQESFFADSEMNPEEFVADLTSMIAPVILPMIHTLGELEMEA